MINVMGSLSLDPARSMWELIDELVDEARATTPVVLVDVHAEATSEKVALARWLDGRVTAVDRHAHARADVGRARPAGRDGGDHRRRHDRPARLRDRRQGRARDAPHAHGDAGALRGGDGRRSDRGRARRVRRRRPGGRPRSGRCAFPGPERPSRRRGPRRAPRARGRGRGRARTTSDRSSFTSSQYVRGNHSRVSAHASDEENGRDRSRARPGTITTIASSQTRNCGDRTLPNATKATTAAAAYRANRAADSVSPRAYRTQTSTRAASADDRRDPRGDAGDRSREVLRARSGRPRERHARSVVESEQHARAEALDLQRPAELPPDAPRHTLGRDEREGEIDDERGADRQRRSSGAQRARPPRFQARADEERQEDGRVDLRRDREAEQDRPECRASVEDRADSGERERCGVEVEPRQDERPEEHRPERGTRRRRTRCDRVEARSASSERTISTQIAASPTVISTSNDRLVADRRVDETSAGSDERDQSPRGVLDREVAIRQVAADDALAVALVDGRVRDPGSPTSPDISRSPAASADDGRERCTRTCRAWRHGAVSCRRRPRPARAGARSARTAGTTGCRGTTSA